jgi:hypothetical protein
MVAVLLLMLLLYCFVNVESSHNHDVSKRLNHNKIVVNKNYKEKQNKKTSIHYTAWRNELEFKGKNTGWWI